MKVVIVGAGLGGLACAIACRREGIDVEVLDRFEKVCEVGAGIQVPPNGTRVMLEFGLLPLLLEKGSQVEQVNFRRYKDGRLLRSMPFGDDIVEEFGAPWIIIHRADYHRILYDEAIRLGAVLRLGAEVTAVSTEEPAVFLADGSVVMAEIVIGGDGQMSAVRKAVLGASCPPIPTGDMAYRATLRREQLEALNNDAINELCRKVAVTSWLGPEKHAIFYPVRGGTMYNLVLMRADNISPDARKEQADIDEIRESYLGWDEILQEVISCVTSFYKWKLTHLPELQAWTKGSVALLGDACHPTLPYQAQGAAMAVEDGAVIGKLLGSLNSHYLNPNILANEQPLRSSVHILIPEVLALYEELRKTYTTQKVHGAIMNRKLFHMQDGILQRIRDFILGHAGVTRKSDWTFLFSFRQNRSLTFDVLQECEKAFQHWNRQIKPHASTWQP